MYLRMYVYFAYVYACEMRSCTFANVFIAYENVDVMYAKYVTGWKERQALQNATFTAILENFLSRADLFSL